MSKQLNWSLDIVLGEDTESDIELFQMALRRCGSVRSLNVVHDGREMIKYLQGKPPFDPVGRQQPNVIIVDLKMPGMDGFEVLKWLRGHPDCSVIPVVVFSSSKEKEDVARAYKLGANAYFEKPSTFGELERILKAILEFWSCAERPPLKEPVCR